MGALTWHTTATIRQTLKEVQAAARQINEQGVEEVVADKGYHSGAVLTDVHAQQVRSYISEPERGRRNWQGEGKAEEQKRTYENRRRVRGERNQRLQKLRSELTERSFAHLYETGGMRRVHLQGRKNILKRLLVHGAAFNLSLILRKIVGVGKPRRLQGLYLQPLMVVARIFSWLWLVSTTIEGRKADFAKQSDDAMAVSSLDSDLDRLIAFGLAAWATVSSATDC